MCTGMEPEVIAALASAAEVTPEAEAALGGIDALSASGVGGMGVAQQGLGSGALGSQLLGALNNPASLASSQGLLANLPSKLAGGGALGTKGLMMAQMGNGMLNPQKPPMPQGAPPMSGQASPMPLPYGNHAGNSLGGQMPQSQVGGQPPLTPEMLRKLRAMGVI